MLDTIASSGKSAALIQMLFGMSTHGAQQTMYQMGPGTPTSRGTATAGAHTDTGTCRDMPVDILEVTRKVAVRGDAACSPRLLSQIVEQAIPQ